MSLASEEVRDAETFASYPYMGVKHVAKALAVSQQKARELPLPWIRVGRTMLRLKPLHLAVYMMSQEVGMTVEEFWGQYQDRDEVLRKARQYIRDSRLSAA